MVGLTVRSIMVATLQPRRLPALMPTPTPTQALTHLLTLSTEPAAPEAAVRSPDDEYTQLDGS